jgi:hypothetical protein
MLISKTYIDDLFNVFYVIISLMAIYFINIIHNNLFIYNPIIICIFLIIYFIIFFMSFYIINYLHKIFYLHYLKI